MNELFEKELRNTSINDKSLADYVIENYVPMSVIKGIKAEIKGMYRVILKGTPKDDWAVIWNDCLDDVLQIIDRYRNEVRE